jgi:hypothetical protein
MPDSVTANDDAATSAAAPGPAQPAESPRCRSRWGDRWADRWARRTGIRADRGMSTAEYAVGTIAACAFAALLFKVVSSPEVQEMLSSLVERALNTKG